MWGRIDQLGLTLVDTSVSATLLAGVVTLAMLSCRQPARRLLLARSLMIALLCLSLTAVTGLLPRYDLLGIVRSSGFLRPIPLGTPLLEPAKPSVVGMIWAEATSRPAPIFSGYRLFRTTLWIYGAGVGVGLGRLALGSLILLILKIRSVEPSEASLARYDLLRDPSDRNRPELRISLRIRRPVLAGLIRPVILIPPELDDPEATDELRLALLHELAHAERHDHWHGYIANISLVFWFFIPPVWWVWSRLRLDQEFVVDQIAAREFGRGGDYAEALLKMAIRSATAGIDLDAIRIRGSSTAGQQTSIPIANTEDASPVYQRVAMLLQCPFPIEPEPPKHWAWPTIISVAAAAVLAASVTIRPRTFEAETPRPRVNTFRMARLDLNLDTAETPGRARLFELPIRLPEKFDLILDVWGDREALTQSRVAGLRLGPRTPSDADRFSNTTPDWHKIHVKRDVKSIEVWIDGQLVLRERAVVDTTAWLSVEPAPGREASYQNLTLTW